MKQLVSHWNLRAIVPVVGPVIQRSSEPKLQYSSGIIALAYGRACFPPVYQALVESCRFLEILALVLLT